MRYESKTKADLIKEIRSLQRKVHNHGNGSHKSHRHDDHDKAKKIETSLNESQQMAHIGNWELDLTTNSLFWSAEIYHIFEIDPKKFGASYEAFLEAIHPDDREFVNNAYTYSVTNKSPYSIDHRLLFADGRIKYVHEECQTFYDKHDKPIRSVGTVQDVTERKSYEQALLASSLYTRGLIEASLDPLVTISQQGVITDVNHATEEVTGYSREQLIGKDFSDYFTEPNKAREGYKKVLKEGIVRDYPLQIRHVSGKTTDVLYNATVYKNQKGELQGIFAAARDITEQKKADELIRLKNEYNRRLIEASLDPLVTIGPDGKITDVNKATEKVTGYTRKKLIGTDFSDYFTEPQKAKAGYQEVFEKGFVRDYPLEIRRKDGHVFSVLYNASVYRDEHGKVVGVFAAARDLTERKINEERLRESESELRAAQRIGSFGNWEWDAINDKIIWSEEYYKIYDVNPAQKPPGYEEHLKVYTPNSAAILDKAVKHSMQTGEPYEVDLEFVTSKGRRKWVTARGECKFDETGRIIGLRGTAQDITDRKMSEQAIASLNRVYKVLSETNQLIIREKDRKRLLEELCRIAVEDGGLLMACVSFVDKEKHLVVPYTWSGKEEGYFSATTISIDDIPEGKGPTGTAIRENRFVFSTDIATEPMMMPWREPALKRGYRSSAAFPLHEKNKIIGAFTVFADEPAFFNDKELALINELAMDVSYALENLKVEEERRLALSELTDSEEKFRKVASSAKDSIIIMDDNGKFLYWNDSFEKLFGYTSNEILGKEVHTLLVPKRYYSDYLKGFRKYQETGEGYALGKTLELIAVNKEGNEFPVELSISVLMFKGRRMSMGILRDITERKQAEEELVRINERLETIFSNTHMMYAYLDSEFNFIRVNRAYAESDGQTPEFFPGKNHFALYPNVENQKIFQKVVDTGEPVTFFSKPFEYADHPERGISYWDWTLQPIKDTKGKVINLLLSLLNVTERVRAELELETSNEQLKQVFDNIDAVVFSLDLVQGKLLKISKACENIYGFKQEKFFENPRIWMTLIHPEDLPSVQVNWQSLIAGKKASSEIEYRIIRNDGETRWIRNETKSITNETGAAIRLDGISYDITERKNAEEERLFHFRFMESLDKVTRAIHGTNDLNQMMDDVLRTVFSIFDCDRIWLFYPCDPDAPSFRVPMEITKPEYPGAKVLNVDIPLPPDMSQNLREVLESADPLTYIIGTEKPVNKVSAEQFGVKSMMMVALHPKSGKPWAFGMHQCSTPRIWTEEEIKLFKEISSRISDGLSSLLFLRELQESEERFRRLAENARDVIYRMSLPDGNYEYISPAALSVFGYSPQEFYNTPTLFKQAIHPDWQKYFEDQWINLVKGKMPPTYEYQIIHKSGEVRWLNQRNILVNDNAGNPIAIEGIVTDITERKLAENELRKLSEAVAQSPASIIITNLNGNIEYVNKTFEETTGYTFAEVINQNPRVLKSGHLPKEEYIKLWNTISSGNTWRGEFQNKKKNGELYWEDATITPIKDKNNNLVNYLAIKQDITEKKKMTEELIEAKERAEKSDKLKTEFLQQMSHEIRSPMNVAISLSNLVKEEVIDKVAPEILEYFEGIDLAGKRLIRTVDLILNTSEMYVGTYEPTFTEIDIFEEVLKHLKAEFGNFANRKGLEFLLTCNISKPRITCDRYSITQVFGNLLDNAIKYTQLGKVEITVDKNLNNNIYVTVADTGIGISGEFMEKLFEPFTQEERGYSRRYEGNGLGLALVKKYCDLNDATINVESEKGKGSKFTITFLK